MSRKPTFMMYILQNGDTNEYKIGWTGNLNKRMSCLQTGCPNELKIVKLYPHFQKKAVQRYERILHNYYTKAGCRIRPEGEWFRLCKSDIAFLCKPNSTAGQNKLIDDLLKMM